MLFHLLYGAIETSLPQAINEITLLRLNRLSDHFDVPLEQRVVVEGMLKTLEEEEIDLGEDVVQDPIPLEETIEYEMMSQIYSKTDYHEDYFEEFDSSLEGKRSKLEGHYSNGEELLASMVRGVFQVPSSELSNEEAIKALLDPTTNKYLSEKMNVNTHTKLMRAMLGLSYTFKIKLSHTADSQSQRHRTTPGVYPILTERIGSTPDVIIPELIESVPEAKELFLRTNEEVWKSIYALRNLGIPEEDTNYLLPNAKTIRKWESGTLFGWHHKMIKRLCYSAQEEIWSIAMDQASEIQRVHPEIGKYFGAPCDLRLQGNVSPYCIEGKRFCGEKVWKISPSDRKRLI
jgi:thymidylate synthase ThyX